MALMTLALPAIQAATGGSLLGSLSSAAGLANSLGGLFGGSKDEGDSMKSQYAWNALSTLNNPMFQVRGLRKAGLNPMLAVGKGIQSGPTVSASPGADDAQRTSRAQLGLNSALALATTANQNAQADLYKAQATKTIAETDNVPKTGELLDQDVLFRRAQTATEAWGPENRKWATELLSAQFNKVLAEKDAIRGWQRLLTEAQTVNYAATTKLINEEMRSARTKADLDAIYSELERIVGIGAEGAGAVAGLINSASALRRSLPSTTTRSGSRTISKGRQYFNETTTHR